MYVCIYLCVCAYVLTYMVCSIAHVWRSENNLQEPVFSFYSVDSGKTKLRLSALVASTLAHCAIWQSLSYYIYTNVSRNNGLEPSRATGRNKWVLLTSAIPSTAFCLSTCKIPFFAVRDTRRSCHWPRVRASSLLSRKMWY